MAKSTVSTEKRKAATEKPEKPHKDFPLFPHATGLWAKKIKGRTCYFGKWDDPQAAVDLYNLQRDDLYAGRTPRRSQDGLTLATLCNRFLNAKLQLRDNGEITVRTFADYRSTTDKLIAVFGKHRLVTDLASDDFEHLRAELAKKRGPVALGNEIGRARVVFKYSYDAGLIDRPIRYGSSFNKPSRKTLRKARAANGKRMFEADELRSILATAPQPLRAMILLGINCGFGQTDVANLPASAVDLAGGWIDYPRPKTGIERRCPLWQETKEALREAMKATPKPSGGDEVGLCFLTQYGRRWVRTRESAKSGKMTNHDAVAQEFAKVLTGLGLKRNGLNFYALRHTFATIAGATTDQVCVNAIMGHVRDDMASLYRERIDDERLRKVTDHVWAWLFAE